MLTAFLISKSSVCSFLKSYTAETLHALSKSLGYRSFETFTYITQDDNAMRRKEAVSSNNFPSQASILELGVTSSRSAETDTFPRWHKTDLEEAFPVFHAFVTSLHLSWEQLVLILLFSPTFNWNRPYIKIFYTKSES